MDIVARRLRDVEADHVRDDMRDGFRLELTRVARLGTIAAAVQLLVRQDDKFRGRGQVMDHSDGRRNSLLAKLGDAQDALDRGNMTVVRNKLAEVIDTCTKRLTTDVANVLIADAQYVVASLGSL